MFKSDVHSVTYKRFKDAGSLYEVHPDLMNIAEQDEVAALLRREIEKVAWGSAALDLRLGRLLAWFKNQDLSAIGFQSYTAFCRERIDWGSTWLRKMVRLANTDLPLVKEAVCQGVLPITVAVEAPRGVKDVSEEQWLAHVMAKRRRRFQAPADDEFRIPFVDEEAAPIVEARHLARLLIGRPITSAQADGYVRVAWKNGLSGQQLIAKAKETPPAPESAPLPRWVGDDPATPLVGPWQEPTSINDGLHIVTKLQQERRNRIVRLGRLYKNIRDNYWVWTMGFDTHGELARHLGLSLRSLQRYAFLVTSFSKYPEMEAAFRQGMDLTRLEVIASIIDETSVARWLEVSKHVTVTELRQAVKWAVDEGSEVVLQKYESAFAEAQETVALRESQDKGDRPQVVYSHPDQLAAATWFVREVQLPPRRGFQKVIERDNHRCQNPRCEAQHLRVQAHHIKGSATVGAMNPKMESPSARAATCAWCTPKRPASRVRATD
jgi:hypothetical protein